MTLIRDTTRGSCKTQGEARAGSNGELDWRHLRRDDAMCGLGIDGWID